MTFEVVDAQVHIWAPNTPERPWAARHAPHRPVPITAESLLAEMQAAGVDRAVLVPPSWEGERNDVCQLAAQKYPERFAVMGRLDPEAPEARDLISHWLDTPGNLGLRFTFHRPSFQPLLTEGKVDWLWPLAEKAGVPIMMTCPFPIMPLIDRVAERHPGLKLVMDHLGLMPGTKDDDALKGFEAVLALAQRPNVAVKCSALPCYTNEPWPHPRMLDAAHRAFDVFGPRRMFWGSDLSRLTGRYIDCVTMFTEHADWLKGEDLALVMGKGLRNFLGWR